jgi:serine/threonine-protein kinase RsbW
MPPYLTRLELRYSLSELARVRAALAKIASRQRVSSGVELDVGLALEEIVTNVITHGPATDPTQLITVRLSVGSGVVIAEIEDEGQPFDPLQAPQPNLGGPLDARPVGGLGIHLVRTLMDEVVYSRRDGRNIVLLKKAF